MKILKKITLGGINSVRGGFKPVALFGLRQDPANPEGPMIGTTTRVRVATIYGVANSYVVKTSENMGTSYGFSGEFAGVDINGEKSVGPECYLPDPAQTLLKQAVDQSEVGGVEFAFEFYAVRSDDSIKGYDFECVPKLAVRSSSALDRLEGLALGHDAPAATQEAGGDFAGKASEQETAADVKPANGKKNGGK